MNNDSALAMVLLVLVVLIMIGFSRENEKRQAEQHAQEIAEQQEAERAAQEAERKERARERARRAKERARLDHEAKQMMSSFLEEMNPKLNQKITKITEEIVVADNNIQQLQALKAEYPNHQAMINHKLNQWHQLKGQLNQVSNRIYQQVERAYVIYKIAEIRGGDKFSLLSNKLLTEANTALTMAESTKQAIEEGTK